MKLRRIIPTYAGWNKLSPQQRASMKRKITSSDAGQPAQ